jgi:hypothetical protein
MKGDFDGWADTITVTDGFLTLSAASTALDPTVCFLEIGPRGSTVDQALRDTLAQAITNATNRTGGEPFRSAPTTRTFVRTFRWQFAAVLYSLPAAVLYSLPPLFFIQNGNMAGKTDENCDKFASITSDIEWI